MNSAHYLRGALRLLLGTALLVGLCVLLADPQAPGRWLRALISTLYSTV